MPATDVLCTLDAALRLVEDGDVVVGGGALLHRKPLTFLQALAASGRRELTFVTFAGSLDVEVLLAHDAVSEVWTAYTGLGHHGLAPRFRGADRARLRDREWSEWTLLGRLRAAAMGLPFLPTRAAMGSDIVPQLELATVEDPHGTGTYLALPPLRPDVAVLHAWRANARGDVQFPFPPEHLWDVDVLIARAARRVVVTVEEVVTDEVLASATHLTRLFGFEVDAVVHAPRGAWPTGSLPSYHTDDDAIGAYAASGGDLQSLVDPVPT